MKSEKELVAVTGGAGYIGSTLCRDLLLTGKYRIRIIDSLIYGGAAIKNLINHPDIELIKIDIRKSDELLGYIKDCRHIIHLAALVGDKLCDKNPVSAVEINYKSTTRLIDNALRCGVEKFIFASTSSNYGIMDCSMTADEKSDLNPVSLYAETKVDAEKYLMKCTEKKFCPVLLRFASAFGISGRTRFDLSVNSFTYEALRDNKIIVFASNTWRPYIHVSDMCRAIIAALEKEELSVKNEVFNVGSNSMNFQKIYIARAIQKILTDVKVDFIEKKDDRSYKLDFSKIKKVMNYDNTRSLEAGIIELIKIIGAGFISEEYFLDNSLDRIKTIV